MIRIGYESWKDSVMRELDPLGVVLKAGVWYLDCARDRGVGRGGRADLSRVQYSRRSSWLDINVQAAIAL